MKRLAIFVAIVIFAAVAWFLASPLFTESIVDEEFPTAPAGLTEKEKMEIERMESLKPEDVDAMPEAQRMEQKRMMQELGQKMPDTTADEPMDMEQEPVAELSGSFRDADSFHKGSGTAKVFSLPNSTRVLRFEDFAVTNGPSLSVYLVRDAGGDVDSGYLDLGKLKGNKGNQNYAIPENVDLTEYKSVIIWCVPFGVTFSVATLR